MSDAAADLRRSYRVAFLRYLSRCDEAALLTGYDLGRQALRAGVGTAAIAAAHHAVLGEVLDEAPAPGEAAPAREALAAGETFLAEVLAAYDLAGRAVTDLATPPDAAGATS